MNALHRERFTALLAPAVAVHAAIHWHASDHDLREEQTQEAIAFAWLIFHSAVLRGKAEQVHPGSISRYAVNLVRATRATDPSAPDFVKKYVNFGASVRAAQFLVLASKARALMKRRYHVTYEDVTTLMRPILRHRILLNFQAESDHLTQDDILTRLLEVMPAPKD